MHASAIRNVFLLARYTHAHHVPHAEHMESLKWQNRKCGGEDAVLSSAYLVHGSVSEVNRSGADVQAVSCHRYLAVFHSLVE